MSKLGKAALAAAAAVSVLTIGMSSTAATAEPASVAGEQAKRQLAIGSRTSGSLTTDDEQLGSGEFLDRYRFTGHRGERVAIELSSDQFDTYAILVQPDGEQHDNDDHDARRSTDSRIETVLPRDGEYEVLVTSYQPGERGRYELSIATATDRRRGAQVQGPRVFAIAVGVSDYGGRANDLSDTDGDAKKIVEVLEQAGVLNPSSVLLTNAAATRHAVEAAFADVARQAGPDDLFLFFFSGHGMQVPAAQGAGELDGFSETIEMRDGPLLDRDLARMLSSVQTRLSLIVLDSCFSGGFDEVMNQRNVMALFSSEEDLTSQIASSYGAGGYLAHFLHQALAGNGDLDGDRLLTVGELDSFLRRRFREEGEIPASTADGLESFQNLVIDRGGVRLDDVLFPLAARRGPARS